MPGPLDWWNRVRRAVGPPGPSTTRAAVPSDVDAGRRAELASVFAHVDRLEAEFDSSEAYNDREVTAIRARAEQDAARLLADANERAALARAAAGAQRRTDLEVQGSQLQAEAEARVSALKQRALEAFPDLVEQALEFVRAFALAVGTPSAHPGSDG